MYRLLLAITASLLLFSGQLHASPFTGTQNDIPLASDAMQVSAFAEPEQQQIRVMISLYPGVYLYQHSLGLRLLDENGNLLNDFADWQPPAGKPKVDEIFGDVEVYYDRLEFTVALNSVRWWLRCWKWIIRAVLKTCSVTPRKPPVFLWYLSPSPSQSQLPAAALKPALWTP